MRAINPSFHQKRKDENREADDVVVVEAFECQRRLVFAGICGAGHHNATTQRRDRMCSTCNYQLLNQEITTGKINPERRVNYKGSDRYGTPTIIYQQFPCRCTQLLLSLHNTTENVQQPFN